MTIETLGAAVLAACEAAGVDHLLTGAFAYSYYGIPRSTKDADFVVVASRRKEGWTKSATVVADSIRLRIGDPREINIEGRLRTCYPLKIIKDVQVDRRIVHYVWPKDMPPLPGLDTESGVWHAVTPGAPE